MHKNSKKSRFKIAQHKIDGQIDSYLSRMAYENILNIYEPSDTHFNQEGDYSNIQVPIYKTININPFDFKGLVL